MNRFDFFFRQKVTEGELDGAFDAVDAALKNWALDNGIVGVTSGGEVTENAGTPNMTVDVAGPASIYQQEGKRVTWTAQQDVDCSVDENSNPTAVTTSGNEKYISLFAQHVVTQSDPRLDGDGTTVYFSLADGFQINVVQGAEALAGTATPPALRSTQILLTDVLLTYGMTQILNADIDDSRREWAFKTSGITPGIAVGTAEEAIQALADAGGLQYGGGGTWHDGTTNPATTVEAQLDKLVAELADESTYGDGGADKIGDNAIDAGTYPDQLDLSAGSVRDHLEAIYSFAISNRLSTYLQEVMNWGQTVDAAGGSSYACKALVWDEDNEAHVMFADTGAAAKALTGLAGTGMYSNCVAFAGGGMDLVHDAVYNRSSNLSVAVGRESAANGAAIQTSANAGVSSWVERTPSGNFVGAGGELFGVAGEGSEVVAVGVNTSAGGEASTSADGGATWNGRTMPSASTALRSVARGSNSWVIVGDNSGAGKIFRIDGNPTGTWTDVTPGGGIAQANSVVYDDATDCYIVVTDDEVLYSDDEGATWTDVSPDAEDKNGVAVVVSSGLGMWVVVGTGDTVYVTVDRGSNWIVEKPSTDRNTAGGGNGIGTAQDYGHMLRYVNGRMYKLGAVDLFFGLKTYGDHTLP